MIGNKRGQGLSTNTIILLVLGIIILVVLILGFTIGWGKLFPFLSSDNVDTIANQCQTACVSGSQYEFCTKIRTLKAEGLDKLKEKGTCNDFSNQSEYPYGIAACPNIGCPEKTE